jgi:hypothetical protein
VSERAHDVDRNVGRRDDEDRPVAPPGGSLEEEGIPDHAGPLPSKEATGDGQEGVVPPGDAPWLDPQETTAEVQREDVNVEEWIEREEPDEGAPPKERGLEIVDGDAPDEEPELVGDAVDVDDAPAAEELAMHVRDRAPGATDDDSDGYVEEGRP